jgi:aryl-alcohol dehydrogenase-like predicted oxidoreductase
VRQWLADAEAINSTIKSTELPAGVPVAQLALAWCLRNPLVSAVIPGCKDAAQVAANALAANLAAA